MSRWPRGRGADSPGSWPGILTTRSQTTPQHSSPPPGKDCAALAPPPAFPKALDSQQVRRVRATRDNLIQQPGGQGGRLRPEEGQEGAGATEDLSEDRGRALRPIPHRRWGVKAPCYPTWPLPHHGPGPSCRTRRRFPGSDHLASARWPCAGVTSPLASAPWPREQTRNCSQRLRTGHRAAQRTWATLQCCFLMRKWGAIPCPLSLPGKGTGWGALKHRC